MSGDTSDGEEPMEIHLSKEPLIHKRNILRECKQGNEVVLQSPCGNHVRISFSKHSGDGVVSPDAIAKIWEMAQLNRGVMLVVIDGSDDNITVNLHEEETVISDGAVLLEEREARLENGKKHFQALKDLLGRQKVAIDKANAEKVPTLGELTRRLKLKETVIRIAREKKRRIHRRAKETAKEEKTKKRESRAKLRSARTQSHFCPQVTARECRKSVSTSAVLNEGRQ